MSPGARLADALDAALPQTQCSRCDYPDCRSYAEAMASEKAPINQCPPGGSEGIARLARLTGRPELPLNPQHGIESPRGLAFVDEAWCIGCTLCLKACPVDCIVGGPKLMHTVVAAQCTGCELCIPACPVDCISMRPSESHQTGWAAWSALQADESRDRYAFHRVRLERMSIEQEAQFAAAVPDSSSPAGDEAPGSRTPFGKSAAVQAMLERARAARSRLV